MAAMKIILAIALIALMGYASAHKHNSEARMVRAKRAVSNPSTCSYMTCAVSGGSCGVISAGHIQLCVAGQHCVQSGTSSSYSCIDNIALGATCNPNAYENECSSGRCVDAADGAGPVCQYFQELMPGSACTKNSECLPSGASGSVCMSGVCAGRNNGDDCTANFQCLSGSFCSSGLCAPLGGAGALCASDSACNSRFSCVAGACTSHFTRTAGQSCSSTINCASGLYCKSGVCAAASSALRTTTACAMNATTTGCDADMMCSCNGFSAAQTSATCTPIRGTYPNMTTIENDAFTCMDQNSCGSDLSKPATIDCINTKCLASYCTYFTRITPDLFNDYPTCLLNRVGDTKEYNALLNACKQYAPSPLGVQPTATTAGNTSAGNAISASLSWILLVSAALFFFEL